MFAHRHRRSFFLLSLLLLLIACRGALAVDWSRYQDTEYSNSVSLGDELSHNFRLQMSPVESGTYVRMKQTALPELDFLPTHAAAVDLSLQKLESDSWVDYSLPEDSSVTVRFPLSRFVSRGATIRNFIVLHFDESARWDNDGMESWIIDVSSGDEAVSPVFPVTVTDVHFAALQLPHFSPFVILWEEVPAAAIESLPDTGDSASLLPWLFLLGASALLLLRRKSLRPN